MPPDPGDTRVMPTPPPTISPPSGQLLMKSRERPLSTSFATPPVPLATPSISDGAPRLPPPPIANNSSAVSNNNNNGASALDRDAQQLADQVRSEQRIGGAHGLKADDKKQKKHRSKSKRHGDPYRDDDAYGLFCLLFPTL